MMDRRSTILPPPDEIAAVVDIPSIESDTRGWRSLVETTIETVRPPKREARDHN